MYDLPPLLALGSLGGREALVLIVIPLFYLAPIWLSYKMYREDQQRWRPISVLASVLLSWIGFIIVRSIQAGVHGYIEQRLTDAARSKKPVSSAEL